MLAHLVALRRLPTARPLLLLCLGGMLAGTTLVACGGTGLGTPPQARQSCGTVQQLGQSVHDPQAAERCFWQHHVICRAAQLVYNMASIDTGTTHTFVEWPTTGECAVEDTAQHYVLPTRFSPKHIYLCSGLKRQTGGLLVTGCGAEGDILIPAANQALDGHGRAIDDALLPHLSPLGWEHSNLTGDYIR